ncbi:MAG: twin-arginine translocase TatA/TatE family subunit [Ilumatobacteraceae bacterium]
MDIGATELIIVLVVVLLIFGGSKVPELARSLGKAQSEFKKGLGGGADEPVATDVRAATTSSPAATLVVDARADEVAR